jgi:hypothetical protein
MKPIDYRTATWAEILKTVEGKRQHVWRMLEMHGPCTTRQLAQATGIDILAIRPRVTELCQLGLARLCQGADKVESGTQEIRNHEFLSSRLSREGV